MSNTKRKDYVERIAKILAEHCPAFYRDSGLDGATWHHCYCFAQKTDLNGNLESCTCVWHETDHCIAGTWPQLDFINDVALKANARAGEYLKQAQQACGSMRKAGEVK